MLKKIRNPFDKCKDDIYDYILNNVKSNNLEKLQKSEILDNFKRKYNEDMIENVLGDLESKDLINSHETFVKFYISNNILGEKLKNELIKKRLLFSLTNVLLLASVLSIIFWVTTPLLINIYPAFQNLNDFQNGLIYGGVTLFISVLVSSPNLNKIYSIYQRLLEIKGYLIIGVVIALTILIAGILVYYLTNNGIIVTIVMAALAGVLSYCLTMSKSQTT